MMLTLLIVAVVAVDAIVMALLFRRRSAALEPSRRGVRTSIDHDPDNSNPFTNGQSF